MNGGFSTAAVLNCAGQGLVPAGMTFEPVFVFADDSDPESVMRGMMCLRRVSESLNVVIGPHSDSGVVSGLQLGKMFDMSNFLSAVTSSAVDNSDADTGFPMVARVGNRYSDMAKGQLQFLKEFGVEKFALIAFGEEEFHRSVTTGMREGADEYGMQRVIAEFLFPGSSASTMQSALKRIIASRVKIIVLMIDVNHFARDRSLLAHANALGMFDGDYAWFGHIWPIFASELLGSKSQGAFMSLTGRLEQSDYQLSLNECLANMPDSEQFYNLTVDPAAIGADSIIYDTVMAGLRFLAEKTVRNITQLTGEAFRNITAGISFDGITGTVEFNEHFERPYPGLKFFNMRQVAPNVIAPIPVALMMSGEFNLLAAKTTFVYQNGASELAVDYDMDCSVANAYDLSVSDCTPSRTVLNIRKVGDAEKYCPVLEPYEISCDHAELTAVGGAIALNAIGVLVTLVCMVTLTVNWRHPMVMSGQREWLLCMCCGAMICQIGFPLGTLGELTRSKCLLSLFSMSTGALLILGSLIVKLVRLRRVMMSRTFRKRKVGNLGMGANVGLLVAANMVVLLIGENMSASRTRVDHVELFTDHGDAVTHEICARDSDWAEMAATALVGLMAVYSCSLANEVRHLSSALSEGVFVFIAVYNATLTTAVVFLFTSVTHDTTLIATVNSAGLLLGCTGTVILLLFKRLYLIMTMPKDTNWKAFITVTSGG
eukprot:CAMPEP_0202081690 /NCGR_PEP_ID=MMETSP0964-20121228/15548_1 /ASSEMBLY_ACC=CAM_ASM_000500 /TAXON_ID=4773 /ORGANISM="Schizochytrium aggregatum, Strain ATCC28209" /LENGTH=712 /DNA_ID=CAMNT_0048649265 /DNA_START=1 /DNA_END=2137 /DNA_ORIENTATION=-